MMRQIRETWNSRLGAILAVSGSAVGLGNFLRFPGQVAEYGGGAYMLAYFVSFLLLGLPICWAEWVMGRKGGQKGFNSCPAIMTVIANHPRAKYLGVIGVVIPLVIYMYYVYIEAWSLGYAVNFLLGDMRFASPSEAGAFFNRFIGVEANGQAMGWGLHHAGGFLLFVFVLNFVLIYRGLSRGIEWFCRYAMPTLVVIAFILLIRVLTLGTPDPSHPERNVNNGLGFMWNPTKIVLEEWAPDPATGGGQWVMLNSHLELSRVDAIRAEVASQPNLRVREIRVVEQLKRPQLWLAAAGQIFFSLSVGFGIILTYASYLKKDDDVVLSGLAATSANEFCEVGLGGLITIPAAVSFIGAAGMAGMVSTFGLGFHVLPMVFSHMPWGDLFGFLFFFLLFLAAATSSLSMLQPGIAFLEEALMINRRQSVAILGYITGVGTFFVFYFSESAKALDTLDFWAGSFLIYTLACIQIIFFGWVMGIEQGFAEAHRGSSIRIPRVFRFIMKYVTPLFLIAVFAAWMLYEVLGVAGDGQLSSYIRDLFVEPHPVAWMAVGLILLVTGFTTLILSGSFLFQRLGKPGKQSRP